MWRTGAAVNLPENPAGVPPQSCLLMLAVQAIAGVYHGDDGGGGGSRGRACAQ